MLEFVEKTFADNYRKEIDQEENVWRSMPFFIATLALEMNILIPITKNLPALTTYIGKFSNSLLVIVIILNAATFIFLGLSIRAKRFMYAAREPALLEYAQTLLADEKAERGKAEDCAASALATLKWALAEQYALATDNNRQINRMRERWRLRAGQAIIFAVGLTFIMAGIPYGEYLCGYLIKEVRHVVGHQSGAPPVVQTGGHSEPTHPASASSDANGGRIAIRPDGPAAAPHAGGS
jgi:hypothetical protein